MDDTLSLTAIDIAGFRRLDNSVSLQFRGEPGVTLFVGPNGSGKSTVLDAVEWMLTGASSRLPSMRAADAKHAPNVFRTLGSDSDPSVRLRFASRSGAETHLIGPDLPGPRTSHFLRRADAPWKNFDATAAALRWTHFSSQRSVAKLGYENGEAVLKDFAGPAGLERNRGLHHLLWGHDTQAAFRAQIRQTNERVKAHRVALDRIDAVLAAGMTTESESGPAQRLADLLAELAREVSPHYMAIGSDLKALEQALLDDRRQTEEALATFRGRASERREAILRLERLEVESEAARQTVDTSVQLQQRRAEQASRARWELEKARAHVGEIQAGIASARDFLGKRDRITQLETELRRLIEESRQALSQLEAAQVRRGGVGMLRTLSARVLAGRALVDVRRSQAQYDSFGDAEAIRDEADRQQIILVGRRDALMDERAKVESAIAGEQDRLQSMAALASALAGHLNEHDNSCPVCAASYLPGELLRRAEAAMMAATPASELLNTQLKDLTHELGRVSGQLQFTRGRRDQAASVVAHLARLRQEEKRHAALFEEPWTLETQERLETEVIELRAQIGVTDEPDVTAIAVAADEMIERGRATVDRFNNQLIALHMTHSALRLELETAPTEADLHARLASLEPRLGRASARQAEAGEDFKLAVGLESAEAQASTRARETLLAMEKDLGFERRRVEDLDRAYRATLGTSDEVDFVLTMDARISRFRAQLEQLRFIRSELERLRHAAQADRDLAFIRATYGDDDGDASIDTMRERISQILTAAELELARIKGLADRLKERARYRRQVEHKLHGDTLQPWNNLFHSIYTSLAGALGETLEWTMSTRASDLRFSDFDARPIPHVAGRPIHGWAAAHFFSEGQLAALQISSMITASILLPWSRWPALLLDDPLQHADVIKVGAFADLMRGLAQDCGHQIFLTTHDAVQAEFIAAKFRSAGLPATILRFERQGMLREHSR